MGYTGKGSSGDYSAEEYRALTMELLDMRYGGILPFNVAQKHEFLCRRSLTD